MIRNSVSTEEGFEAASRTKDGVPQSLPARESKQALQIAAGPRENGPGGMPVPASLAQERLWFIDQLEGGGNAYNIGIGLRFRGILDRGALQKAFERLLQRHDVLRTVFASDEGNPRPVILPAGCVDLRITDLSGYDEVQREQHEPFDLRAGPLVRARLLTLQAEEHVLLMTGHRIVLDEASMALLIHEWAGLYGDYRQERSTPPYPLPSQHADYAQWQREWIHGEVCANQLSYWRARLEGAPLQLQLPGSGARPATRGYRGKHVPVSLDTVRLKAFARRHDMTLSMVLCAGFAILLSRLSGQSDIVIGTPVANRRRREFAELLGPLESSLVLRVDVARDAPLEKFLAQVKEVTLGAYDHQDVPFEKLVQVLQPDRNLERHPLFQAMFALQTTRQDILEWPGLTVALEDTAKQTSKLDLLLTLEERGDGIQGAMTYDADLFDRQTVERWTAYFAVLLGEMTGGERSRIGSLQMLPEGERRCVVEQFNATRTKYPHHQLIHELFEEQVRRTPDAVAVMHERRSLTYAELNSQANRLACYLIEQGAGPDQLVAICVERSLEMVVGLLGILKSGGAYVPLDPNYPLERLKYMLQDAAPRAVLTQSELRKVLPETQAEIIELDTTLEEVTANRAQNISADELGLTAENLLYVIYTSGSTGRPKGTAMPHRCMVNLIEWHRDNLPTREGQRVLQTAALSFDVSFQETFSTLCTGGTLVLLDEWIRKDARALLELVRAETVERLFIPPLMLQAMAECYKSTGIAPRSLKDIIVAGEQLRISSEIVDFFNALDGCRLHNHYGPTETHLATALTLAGRPEEWPALPPIGRPIANAQIYVLDSEWQPASIGVVGEIYIGGANVARGYLNRPELTAQRFIENPFSAEPHARLYRTGDLGRWQVDGTLEYLGRNDDQVKIRGYRIELGEIETRLARHPRVAEAAVVAREDSPGEKRLVAYVTARDQSSPSTEELRAFLNSELPEYMVPATFVKLDRLPLNPNGKLDRASLPAPDSGAHEQRVYEAPEGAVEIALASIWEEVLKVDRVGRHDSFFELGGDSLLVMRAASRIRQRWNPEFSVRELFRHPSLRALAASIAHTEGSPLPPIVIADRSAPLPLSFAQQRLWFLCQMKGVSASYNNTSGLRLKGQLDAAALQAGLNRIVARHEALRTTFAPLNGGAVQVVLPATCGWNVVTQDLRSHSDAESELRRIALFEANDPFDLEQGPLCRGRLIRLAGEEHVLLLTLHHLVSDGWSMAVLFNELSSLYGAFRRGAPDPLPAPPIQYADYAIWQRGWLVGERLQRQAEYWKQTLEAAPALLNLPTDRPRPPVQTYRGDDLAVSLDPGLTRHVRALGQRHGASLFTTLMAGWIATLSRLSGQKDLVIGTPTANRTRTEIEGLIGFFVNTLALRMDLSGSPTVADLLRRVNEQMLAAQSHADIGFEQVVEVVKPVRSAAHSPIFQVLMAWQNTPPTAMELAGLQLAPMTIPYELAKFDLSLSLAEVDDQVAGTIIFATSLFERDTVNRYVECWKAVLQAMVEDAQQEIERLPCPLYEPDRVTTSAALDAEESRQLAYEAPTGETEVALAEIWTQILGVDRVGRHDNFFGLGGTSLQLLLVMNRITEILHVTLGLEGLYSSVTLTDLARNVTDAQRTQPGIESGAI